ncbi:MAG: DUF805 domain-containing protein [Bradyrhizobium sp.]|uniref:DUF805 domain-containing protein n=1 Tax=Bradyrhizobium sp. TaxID=376 RepID=UPI0011FB66E3|nr:DUF805 domain-containing protein [Bradyrhizobium sp.]THD60138.1 MAG: DUF805 domain-containing protein [Bradyrhizobium sp.]
MLGFLFGFNARLGRLQYFFATIGLAVLMTAICFAIAIYVFGTTPRAMLSPASLMNAWPVIAAMVFFGWATFTLQSMRIRDIGWDPVCVIPAWIAILIVDKIIAGKIPAWSLDHDRNGTVVGALTNLVLVLALMFWPSGDYQEPFNDAYRIPVRPAPRTATPSAAAERIARASGGGFGRRGF